MTEINKIQYLQIGVQGENEATNIEIDMTAWADELSGSAVFGILFKPYNSADPAVPVTTSYDAETKVLTWTVTANVTQLVGVGYTEVRAVDGSVIKKSRIIPTSVENSVTGAEVNPPAAYQDWYTQVLNSAALVLASAHGQEIGFEIDDDGHLIFSYTEDDDDE